MSFLIFLIVLSVLIIVHEFGHFVVAKALGVKVERFALGFGPKIISKVYGGTEFMLCVFPLGGYVKMAGDERDQCKGLPDEYFSKPPGHRSLIVLMGPVVNYLLAYLCFCLVFVLGYPTIASRVGEVLKGYPAEQSGLKAGDTIVRIEDKQILSWEDIQQTIATSVESQLDFEVLREDETHKISVTPQKEVLENIFGQKETVRVVGIKPVDEIIILKYPPHQSLVMAFLRLKEITTMTYKALYRMATGAMSPKETMTGPIGIFYIIKKAAEMGFPYLLYIVGVISASLAIFNLLPFPILDGGHLVLLGLEKVRGQALPKKVDETIARVGFSLIICLALFVFYSDFVRFGWIDKFMSLWQR